MKKLLFLVFALTVTSTTYAADSFSTVEERMSGKEFKATGLGKLTDAELAELNDWLRRHSVATLENTAARASSSAAVAGATTDLRGFENQPKDDPNGNDSKEIHGTIVGTFSGWNGKGEIFKLTNGMIWQATENDTFSTQPTENAQVTIHKSFMGNWRLSMDGHGAGVRVKRIN
ncbi:MAG: hypothetical protein GQ538_00270 [Xanthomonadales bacterium]|nr:hypothetical protein [Xanthomonadales bacterium]